jgi:hypothetical protein
VIKNVMLKETVDGEFTTVEDVAEAALFFAAFNSNALTGQSQVGQRKHGIRSMVRSDSWRTAPSIRTNLVFRSEGARACEL